jgi:hypothetical protein
MRARLGLVVLTSLEAACGRVRAAQPSDALAGPVVPSAADASAGGEEGRGRSIFEIEVSAAGEEEAKLESIVATLDALLASESVWVDFETVAMEHPQIFVGPEFRQPGMPDGMADPSAAASLVSGSDGRFHVFSAILGVTGTYYPKGDDYEGTCESPQGARISCRGTAFRQNYSNELAVTHGIGLVSEDARELVSIEIGRAIFDRYNSPSIIRRSCTYNTVAHELTHTIGKDQEEHWTIVVDSDQPVPRGVPQLSYLFGSVVQCSWLQDQGAIGAGDDELRACVRKFGVDRFSSESCE